MVHSFVMLLSSNMIHLFWLVLSLDMIHSWNLMLSRFLVHSNAMVLLFTVIHSEELMLSYYVIHSKMLVLSGIMIHSSSMVLFRQVIHSINLVLSFSLDSFGVYGTLRRRGYEGSGSFHNLCMAHMTKGRVIHPNINSIPGSIRAFPLNIAAAAIIMVKIVNTIQTCTIFLFFIVLLIF